MHLSDYLFRLMQFKRHDLNTLLAAHMCSFITSGTFKNTQIKTQVSDFFENDRSNHFCRKHHDRDPTKM